MVRFPRRALAAIFSTAVGLALVFSFKTPDTTPVARTANTDGRAPTTAVPGSGSGAGSGAGPGSAATTRGSLRDGTVTGQLVDMRYGPVQVQVTVSGGKVTDVTAIQLPAAGRSGRISSIVEPMLRSEALTAQTANIDIISGATYTSESYAQSLQSALDQARG
jgi:uncharacterized protein with FMN-binding domain